jgi:hypothetical protein
VFVRASGEKQSVVFGEAVQGPQELEVRGADRSLTSTNVCFAVLNTFDGTVIPLMGPSSLQTLRCLAPYKVQILLTRHATSVQNADFAALYCCTTLYHAPPRLYAEAK